MQALIHHTAPPAALPAVVPPCGVWLIRPQSSRLAAFHPAPYGGQGGGATHGPQAKQKLDGGFGQVGSTGGRKTKNSRLAKQLFLEKEKKMKKLSFSYVF